jgi:P4 family phage/plasmid primase-like protien
VLAETLEKFYIDRFFSKLDSDENLMGMLNGIIEACDMEAILRPGKPEDYVSKTTGVMWRPDLHWKHPLVEALMSWLRKVFPSRELVDYFGKLAGSCIRGRNSEKIFPVMTGKGDNSKSMIKKIFEAAFGSYCITFPTELFTAKRQNGGPSPELARSKACRVGFLQEPDSDDAMKGGKIKEMTGGDKIFARSCNQDGDEIDMMLKIFLMCNHVPIIPNSDKAIKNRVRILPFLSTWSKTAPATEEEQFAQRLFPMDPFFERQIPKLTPAFMWYCVQMYALYRKEGLMEPDIIKESTTEYWKDNDLYLQFVGENIEKAYKHVAGVVLAEGELAPVDEEAKITVTQMYQRFKDWHRECYGNLKIPDRSIFKAEMEARINKAIGKVKAWHGIKFKVEVAEI